MGEQLQQLKKKRSSIKAQIIRFQVYFNEREQRNICELKLRLQRAESLWDEYEKCQARIETFDEDCDHNEERTNFENMYFKVISRANEYLSKQESVPAIKSETVNSLKVQLPTINLPTFDGSYENWCGFYESFQSIVHENSDIPKIHKFHYLKSCLTADAAKTIDSLQMSSENYEIAFNLLIERYSNKKLIVQKHIKALFNLPNIIKDSHESLRQLLDNTQKNLRALKALGQPIEMWDAILLHLITSKFDRETHKAWEHIIAQKDEGTMQDMYKFLHNKCQVLESIFSEHGKQNIQYYTQQKPQKVYKPNEQRKYQVNTQQLQGCPKCSGMHQIYACEKFLEMDIPNRADEIKKLKLCFNCLGSSHQAHECKSGWHCKKCPKRHNTLLHENRIASTQQIRNKQEASQEKKEETTTVHYNIDQPRQVGYSQILLSTAIIQVYDSTGKTHPCKALLDSGAQSNLITEKMAKILSAKLTKVDIAIKGISQHATNISHSTRLRIKSQYNNFNTELTFLTMPRITEKIPMQQIQREMINIPQELNLADPTFHETSEIDMLIGAELFYNILCVGQIRLQDILLQKTHFGWIVSGKINQNLGNNNMATRQTTNCHLSINKIENQLHKFWELEEYNCKKYLSKEEEDCENHYNETIRRDQTGRYVAKLPFKHNQQDILGESYNSAVKRFHSLERKLETNQMLKEKYTEFMQEYVELGHMTKMPYDKSPKYKYYLPHHAVIKESSTTTKTRVVFDASAPTSNGLSLNNVLLTGPTIQDDLFTIISRFRLHTYVLSADIEKMYRQILIDENDRTNQVILWRNNPEEELATFQLNTVTYGVTSSPYLAIRTLHQLADDEIHNHSMAAKILKTDFYVDDLLTGTNTLEEAQLIKSELTILLQKGGFNLRKWNSNDSQLLNEGDTNQPIMQLEHEVKTLGLQWNPEKDAILYHTTGIKNTTSKVSKRKILSEIASLFDPLGLLGTIIIKTKILMQQLWILKLGWDESVPMSIHTEWKEYTHQLPVIENILIPRQVIIRNAIDIQLHGFCDASESAYGACIYLQSNNEDNSILTRLVCSKTRVAPLKNITLPRLELCAAVLLARLYKSVTEALNINFKSVHFWSDSSITLYWLRTSPHKLKTFVANRVSEVQNLTNINDWNHIKSEENPADFVSRGLFPSQLVNNQLWWTGPSWLTKDKSDWPITKIHLDEIPELKTVVLLNTQDQYQYYSNFSLFKR